MAKNRGRSKSNKAIGRLAWLGAPPLLPSESPAEYDQLLAKVSTAVRPTDAIEEILIRDIVDLTWEVWRGRRLKDHFIAARCHDGLKHVLATTLGYPDAEALAKRWAQGDEAAINGAERNLTLGGLTMDAAVAETFARNVQFIELIDDLIISSEARRNTALHEIERHRSALASATQRAVQHIENAEFREINTKPVAAKRIRHDTSQEQRAQARG